MEERGVGALPWKSTVSALSRRQSTLSGTKMGPRSGSEFGVNGSANGSPGTGRKWKPFCVALRAQPDTCRNRHTSMYMSGNRLEIFGDVNYTDKNAAVRALAITWMKKCCLAQTTT